MNRTTINLAVDLAIAALFLALIGTGFILGFALPPGTNKALCLWGLSRHQFGDIHLWISLSFLGFVVLHVSLHWQWVVAVVGKHTGRKVSPQGNLLRSGLATFLLLAVAVGVFSLVSRASVRRITDSDKFDVCPDSASPAGGVMSELPARPDDSMEGSRPPAAFWKDIYPVLQKNCLSCHGPQRQRGGFRVDRRQDFFGQGGREQQIVPGDSGRSPLIAIVSGLRTDMARADAHQLPEREVNLLRAWIDAGAAWPDKSARE
jgi:mono/diheme cytochrome c family protein